MYQAAKAIIRPAAQRLGGSRTTELPPDFDEAFGPLYARAAPFTMTSIESMYALYEAVGHVVRARIPGDVVECGVWRGGSAMLAALALKELGETGRRLWLYDTYEGMPPAGEQDVRWDGQSATEAMAQEERRAGAMNVWSYATLADVRANLATTHYANVEYVAGRVESTLPARAPEAISVLRLDTDWYESTRHELAELYPRLSPGGVLIIDDYGWWKGQRQAVDEYFATQPVLLNRIDWTGRVAVKPQ